MFKDVANGLGDIAAGNLTVTGERLRLVDFVSPDDMPPTSELLVTGPKSPSINLLDDLAGKTVHVRKASSYYESLLALNERFQKEGRAPITLTFLPDALEDEDIMEMLNAGLLETIVVKDWMAKMWAQILPKINVRTDIIVRSDDRIGWAIRKDSRKLDEEIRDFFKYYAAYKLSNEAQAAQRKAREHLLQSESRPL